jgi:hypothetical protein
VLRNGTQRPARVEPTIESRDPRIERLSSGRYNVRVTWIDPKTGKVRDLPLPPLLKDVLKQLRQ